MCGLGGDHRVQKEVQHPFASLPIAEYKRLAHHLCAQISPFEVYFPCLCYIIALPYY